MTKATKKATKAPRKKAPTKKASAPVEVVDEPEVAEPEAVDANEVEPESPLLAPPPSKGPSGYFVELIEGSSLEVRGMRFVRGRRIFVADKILLDAVLTDRHFRCTPVR